MKSNLKDCFKNQLSIQEEKRRFLFEEDHLKHQDEVRQLGSMVRVEMKLVKMISLIRNFKKIIQCLGYKLRYQFHQKKLLKKLKEHLYSSAFPPTEEPLISVILLIRNTKKVDSFIKSMLENTVYSNFELILINSSAKVILQEKLKNKYSINIAQTYELKSSDKLSHVINKAAESARGKLLALLDDLVYPQYGWLNMLVSDYLRYQKDHDKIGFIGSTLVNLSATRNENFTVKSVHSGISFKYFKGRCYPIFRRRFQNYFLTDFQNDPERVAFAGTCKLISTELYLQIGGLKDFDNYRFMELDLSLQLYREGYINFASSSTAFCRDSEYFNEFKEDNFISLIEKKWSRYIRMKYWDELLYTSAANYSEQPLTVGFVVTEIGPDASAGDFFTANELAIEFEKFNWKIKYYTQKSGEWYNITQDTDILIVMLHHYDLSKIESAPEGLIKVAWIRNWFDEFTFAGFHENYDLILASSKTACSFISKNTGKRVEYFSIATNWDKFSTHTRAGQEYISDYCFTGSYWHDPRELISMLDPQQLPEYRFHLYGKNWKEVDKFLPYYKGFIPYEELPDVYSNTKILIDDANRVTKPWGALNSRVYDAIAAGIMVITNSKLGSEEIFDGVLPVYSSQEELFKLLKFYLENEEERLKVVEALQEVVKNNHTYDIRANAFREILNNFINQSVAIKIPVPQDKDKNEWGDYHFAESLKEHFETLDYRVRIFFLEEWESEEAHSHKYVLVLRGLNRCNLQSFQQNFMWNISHPDKISLDEYNEYDHVFIASELYAKELSKTLKTSSSALLQCTDDNKFKLPSESEKIYNKILFVGNSRKVFRTIVKDIEATGFEISVYGTNWEAFVSEDKIKGTYIPNEELFKYYGGAEILLNDHWDDMRDKGFISNRIFDGLASGAFIISDNIKGIPDDLKEYIVIYHSQEELKELITYFISRETERKKIALRGREVIKNNHTFMDRIEQIILKFKES